jgi:hypothetical protein
MMDRTIKVILLSVGLVVIALFISCASSKQNPYYQKRKQASHVNTTQVGRNKYFFSNGYQKKLVKGYKKK